MKKIYFLLSLAVIILNCREDRSHSQYHAQPVTIDIGQNNKFVNEYVRYQLSVVTDTIHFRQCSEGSVYAVLQRKFNGIWTSLNSFADSSHDIIISDVIIDSIFLPDSGYFRIMIPYFLGGNPDTLFSDDFIVSDSSNKGIFIWTDKVSYSSDDLQMHIDVLNRMDSSVYFTKCGGNTDYYIDELSDCNHWETIYMNGCLALFARQWIEIEPDSVYHDWLWVNGLQKGTFRFNYFGD